MKQNGLFEGETLRDEALQRAERHAAEKWKQAALEAVEFLARNRSEFTSEAVLEILERSPYTTHEPRAMGAVIRKAHRVGFIEPTDVFVPSVRSRTHRMPKRVWASRLFKPSAERRPLTQTQEEFPT